MLETLFLERSQSLRDFWPIPPYVGSLLILSVGKFQWILTHPPIQIADILNRCKIIIDKNNFRFRRCTYLYKLYITLNNYSTLEINSFRPGSRIGDMETKSYEVML